MSSSSEFEFANISSYYPNDSSVKNRSNFPSFRWKNESRRSSATRLKSMFVPPEPVSSLFLYRFNLKMF